MNKLFFLAAFLFLASCATTARVSNYTDEDYPSKPGSSVEVFRTSKPTKPYIEIGEVTVRIKRSNEDRVVEMLREKAGELGADGLILMGEHLEGTNVTNRRSLYGVAIKYKE